MKPRNPRIVVFLIIVFTLFTAFTVYSFTQEIKTPKLPYLGQVLPFELINQEGNSFGLAQLKNKVWIADFFFTTCGDICPLLTKNMASLSRSFEKVPHVEFVSISVNPEYDSPETLAKYSAGISKGKDNWSFLTGPREKITDLVIKSFKLGDIKDPVFHSSSLALVDKNGYIRGYYDGTNQEEVNKLFKDSAVLAKEKNYHGFRSPGN